MTSPAVSILIPVYNREKLLGDTIKSAAAQTYSNLEIIVSDNCSTDRTLETARRYAEKDKRIRVIQNPSNIGPVANWRKCLDYSGGKYSKILWSDDLISADFLEKTVPLMDDPSLGFVTSGIELFDEFEREKTGMAGKSGRYLCKEFIRNSLLFGDVPVSPGCALFRTDDLREAVITRVPNRINSDFAMHGVGPDLLIFLLISLKYEYFFHLNEVSSFFRRHRESISISMNAKKIFLYYLTAQAWFVSEYIQDRQLIRSFNTRLAFAAFRHGHVLGMKTSDFYPVADGAPVGQGYDISYPVTKLLHKLGIKNGFSLPESN